MRKKNNKFKIFLLICIIVTVSGIATSMSDFSNDMAKPANGPNFGDVIQTEQNVYYVSPSGSDRNNGLTIDTPFRTIQKAAEVVKPGDTVLVREGIYNEGITMKTSGTPDAPILFSNYKTESPIIDGTAKNIETGVQISSKDNIIFQGFTVRNFTSDDETTAIGISIVGSAKNIEIRNCKVHDISTTYSGNETDRNAHGIAVYGTSKDPEKSIDGLILDSNEVYLCRLGQSEAVALNGNVRNFKVTNNKIHDNDNIGIGFIGFEGTANGGSAGDPKAGQDRARNGICSGNEVSNISSAKNATYQGEGLCAGGIYADGGYDILIENNKISSCDIGIEAASEHHRCSTEKITIRNNLIANCKGVGGISFGGADSEKNGTAKGINIINNTLYNNRPNINIQNADSSTNIVINNICYRGTYLEGAVGKNIISDNYTANPQFVNTTMWDFSLKPHSAAIDKGTEADYGDTDMAGNPRIKGSAVDYGAFEFQQ